MKFEKQKLMIWNSSTHRFEEERVFGEGFVKFCYQNPLGKILTPLFTHNTLVSRLYGWYQSQPASAVRVDHFVKEFQIHLEDFEGYPYSSFNDFFIRPFKKGRRPFVEAKEFPAPCEARYT